MARGFCGSCGQPLSSSPVPVRASTNSVWIVGCDPSCDIHIEAPSISGRHLEIRRAGEKQYRIRDLNSTNGTYYLGRKVQEALVDVRDIVQIGLHPFRISRVESSRLQFSRQGAKTIVVGREATADIVLPLDMVSSRHLEIRSDESGVAIRDLGSTNGTYIDNQSIQGWAPITLQSTLALGSFRVPRSAMEQWFARLGRPTNARQASQITIPEDGRIILGRDPDCDVSIDASQVSWHHAEIVSKKGRWVIRDLKSSNGVFLNGSRVRVASLHPEDALSLGSHKVQLSGHQISSAPSAVSGVRLDAMGVSRVVPTENGPLTILDDVSVSVFPGEMVALMGPSGAGKSTLLEVLTGQRQPNQGRVLFNGQCLHGNFDKLKFQIGYVPQDDIMHRDLTVFEVLMHVARSWDPHRPRDAMVKDVGNVLASMGLSHIANSKVGGTATIRGISGGQRKRVNIAMELLKSPKLLFLDEPTSGLDSRATMEVIRLLKELADNGTTIVMTIHQPRIEAFQLMSHLLLLTKGGRLAYFGEAVPGAAAYFASRSALQRHPDGNPADYVIDVLDPEDESAMRSTGAWQQEYMQSKEREIYVRKRQNSSEGAEPTRLLGAGRRQPSAVDAYVALTLRYGKRKLRDRTALLIQFMQAPVVAFLLGWLFWDAELDVMASYDGVAPGPAGVHQVLFLLSATAFWFGCSNVAREIVSERSVFRRECRSGLSTGAYLASLFSVQVCISLVQVLLLTGIAWTMVGLPLGSIPMSFALLLLTAVAGVSLGLLVSAVARTEVTALSVIPVILIPQLMFSGYLKLFRAMVNAERLEWVVSALTPMRWCFEGLLFFAFEYNEKLGKDGSFIEQVYGFEPWSDHWPGEFVGDSFMLLLFIAFFAGLTYFRLVRTSQSSNS